MKKIIFQTFIPVSGWIISLLTFPGVILHELSHWVICKLFNVHVYEVKFFSLNHVGLFSTSPLGWVIHEKPRKFIQSFLISVGPFFINSFLASIFFFIMTKFNVLLLYLFFWLGLSSAVNSFPSTWDAKTIWYEGNAELKKRDYLVLLVYPIILLIYIANILSIIWFDFLYAILLCGIVSELT